MLKKIILISFLLLSSLSYAQTDNSSVVSVTQSGNFDFVITPGAFHLFGETQFNLEQTVLVIDTAGQILPLTTRSLLEFPLDVFMIGGSIGLKSKASAEHFWSAEIGFHTNVSDPKEVMKDSDWFRLPGYFDGMISYTESDAKMNLILFNAEVYREIFNISNVGVAVLAGYRYQKIDQNIVGFTGWQIDSSFAQQPISGTEPAIDYRVTYKGPQVGLLTKMDLSSSLEVTIKTAASLTYIDDFDDHLLRKFHTFSEGQGLGLVSNLNARWYLHEALGGNQTFVDFVGSFDYFSADISQTFEQYGNGGPLEAPQGFVTGNLPHEIESRQFRFGIRFGLLL